MSTAAGSMPPAEAFPHEKREIYPKGDTVCIRPLRKQARTIAGLHVATAGDPNRDNRMGTVIAMGVQGKRLDDGTFEPMRCQVGDVVIVGRVLECHPFGFEGGLYLLAPNDAVLAVVVGAPQEPEPETLEPPADQVRAGPRRTERQNKG